MSNFLTSNNGSNIIYPQPGSYGFGSGRGCEPCACGGGAVDQSCDPVTGQCRCRPGLAGPRCDQCDKGYWNYSPRGCQSEQAWLSPGASVAIKQKIIIAANSQIMPKSQFFWLKYILTYYFVLPHLASSKYRQAFLLKFNDCDDYNIAFAKLVVRQFYYYKLFMCSVKQETFLSLTLTNYQIYFG